MVPGRARAPVRTCGTLRHMLSVVPECVAHVDASALRGRNELVASHQVSAETPERALGIPIDTVYDLCAACAALGGGGGL